LVTGVGVAFTLSSLASSDDDLATPPSPSPGVALSADEPVAAWGVTIETLVDGGGSGTFVASGEAVDDGELCTDGVVTTLGTQSGETENGFWFEYEMFCSDRSGTFMLRVSSPVILQPDDYGDGRGPSLDGAWNVASGTRKFVTLGGSGAMRTVFESDRCINRPRAGVDKIACGFWVRTYSGEVIRP
jgi:hypothetical protein